MGPDRLVDLVAHLASHGVRVWLDGGWAIDALLGRQRRRHDDLDVVAALEDVAGIEAALGELGYLRVDAGDARIVVMLDAVGHQVDIHPVVFDGDGDGIYRMNDGKNRRCLAAEFAGQLAGSASREALSSVSMKAKTSARVFCGRA